MPHFGIRDQSECILAEPGGELATAIVRLRRDLQQDAADADPAADREVLALQKAGEHKPLSACLEDVDAPAGRQRVSKYLRTRPFPHYEQEGGRLVRIDKDGTRTAGRFVNRQFQTLRRRAKK